MDGHQSAVGKNIQQSDVKSNEASQAHLTVSDMYKEFNNGQIVAVEDFSLRVSSDEFIVFLGPSGCGKTTTLRCISGLDKPTSGEIYIDGSEVTNMEPKNRDLAFVFQNVALFPHMSVRRNMRFGLDMKTDMTMQEKNGRVEETAEVIGLDGYLERSPSALSGGQQQRVSLGRAMVMDPEAFLLDEPFSALDANLKDQMQTEIQRIQNKIEKSMIFVTHDQKEAMSLGDRIVIMNDGQVEQVGSPYEIYNEPVSLFVARFIGSPSTNIIKGMIKKEKEQMKITTELFSFDLEESRAESVKRSISSSKIDKRPVSIGIRPSQLALTQDNGLFQADISVIEPQGDRDTIHLMTDDRELRAVSEQGNFTEVGTPVFVDVDQNDIWIFDESGERLL